MHLLQIYKLFPFEEDLEEYMDEVIWQDWDPEKTPQRGSGSALENTLLAEPDLDPQQWLLALHLMFTWPDRSDAALLMRELNVDAATAQKAHVLVKEALAESPDFYARLTRSLGSCVRCG